MIAIVSALKCFVLQMFVIIMGLLVLAQAAFIITAALKEVSIKYVFDVNNLLLVALHYICLLIVLLFSRATGWLTWARNTQMVESTFVS